jgi:hypothetical protein
MIKNLKVNINFLINCCRDIFSFVFAIII